MMLTEGKVRIEVPEFQKITSKNKVFYNPEMRLDRDLSSLILSFYEGVVLDGLSATGIRGIRYVKESGLESIFNDINPEAVKLIAKNCKMNDMDCKIYNRDLNVLDVKADIVDIDPFGSPSRYLASGFRIIKSKGVLCVTATDTQALCVSKKACIRKYSAIPLKTDFFKELGIRILISSILREAMKQVYSIDVLLAYAHKHYMRVFLSVKKSLTEIEKNIKNLQIVYYCTCGYRTYSKDMMQTCPNCGKKINFSLPVWTGKIKNDNFLDNVMKKEMNSDLEKILNAIKKEIIVPFYYDVHKLAKTYKFDLKKIDLVLDELKRMGFQASRTHFSKTGIKTDADLLSLLKIFR